MLTPLTPDVYRPNRLPEEILDLLLAADHGEEGGLLHQKVGGRGPRDLTQVPGRGGSGGIWSNERDCFGLSAGSG